MDDLKEEENLWVKKILGKTSQNIFAFSLLQNNFFFEKRNITFFSGGEVDQPPFRPPPPLSGRVR